jgi:hypothetical protein
MYNDINDRIKKALLESLSLKTEMKSKTIESQKTCAHAALNMLHIVDPYSCILGGAPRDWALGNPAKDLDIYIHGYPNESRDSIKDRISQALQLQADELEDVTNNSYYTHSLDNGVVGVLNVKNCFMPIQIVLCDRQPIEMLNTFHGSLSKASYTRGYYWDYLTNSEDYELDTSVEFDISKEFKVHLIRKNDDPKYIAKIKAKYPEFTHIHES